MKVDKLEDVYKNFDPLVPLPGNSEFYVQRKRNPLNNIRQILLRENPSPLKILFSGHRGSGKSTELNQLMADDEIQKDYFVIHYSVKQVLDTAGLDYIDLLVSIGAQTYLKAQEMGLMDRDSLLNELDKWRSTIEKEVEKGFTTGGEGGISAGLANFFNQLLIKLKIEYTNRIKIRQTLQLRMAEMIDIINLIMNEVKLKSGNDVLVAIDDLDKPDLKIAEEIFYQRKESLTYPECNIIYTVPIALYYSQNFGQVKQNFTKSYVLPNVAITHKDHSPNIDGRNLMKEFVKKRMSPDLIDKDALEHAITISGGLFREMTRLIGSAGDEAISRDDEKIRLDDVKLAESEIRNEFRRMLRAKDYNALKKIHESCDIEDAETCAELMHNLSVLEYQNDGNWCDVHPAIVSLIEE